MDDDASRRQKFFDEVGVVVEVSREEHGIVFVLSAQQFVKKGRLFDALLIKVRFEAVIGKCDDFVSA